jgi:hypothetical protein
VRVAEFLDAKGFRHLFDDRVVVFTNLPSGSARQLAERVKRVGRGDATLRTGLSSTLYLPIFGRRRHATRA